MKQQNENSKQGDLKTIKASGAVYSIITSNRTPSVRPGEKVEIEVFLSGHGKPKKNKLHIQWSLPYVINKEDPGFFISCIGSYLDEVTEKPQPCSGKSYVQKHRLNPTGITVILNEGQFLEISSQLEDSWVSEFGISPVMSEGMWDDEPPILLSINTTKNAPSGDYDVKFILTYGNEQNLLQDYKTVPFHITSRWERHKGWIVPTGVIIALVTLLLTAFGTFYRIFLDP